MSSYSPTYFRTYSPRVRALVKDIETAELLFDLSDDIISLATNKAYGRCSGTWQMMLTWKSTGYGARYDEILKPNMMLTIEKDAGNGAGYFPVMCGLVDRVSVVRQGGTVPQRSVKVSGRDMGKLLEVHDVAYDIISWNEQVAKNGIAGSVNLQRVPRNENPLFQTGTPGNLIKLAWQECIEKMLKTVKRISFIDTTKDKWKQWQPNLMTTQGTTFWQYAKQMQHHPFNVLTTDTHQKEVDKFHLMLEPQPIDEITGRLKRTEDRWHTIGDAEIVSDDLGVSDHERINLICYQPVMYSFAGITKDAMMVMPQLMWKNDDDIMKHGLCSHVVSDQFLPPSVKSPNDRDALDKGVREGSKTIDLLTAWYSQNHTYESGTVTIHLRPDIRVGSGLLIKQPEGSQHEYKEYLIEQVAHSCIFHPQPQFVTTLHLTRGQEAAPRNADNAKPPSGGKNA